MTWNIDPVLFSIGPLEIRYYGVFFALSLFLAYLVAQKLFKIKGFKVELLDNLAVYLILGIVIGARFGHILFYQLDYYLAHPGQILQVWNGGLASHGAAIGLIVAYALFLWRHPKVRFFDFADVIAVVIAIPAALVRLGNFFNSELVGRPTEVPWAVNFERVDSLMRHPSQIYEFLMASLIFAILYPLWLKTHAKRRPGFFLGLFMMLYFSFRFTVEFFKDFPLHDEAFSLTTGQLLSIPFFLLGLGTFLWGLKKKK